MMKEYNNNVDITFKIASTTAHFEQILELQRQNHFSYLSEENQLNEGFVFAAHTLPVLQLMAASVPQVIAMCGEKLVGYNLAMTCAMEHELPSLVPMFQQFKKWNYDGLPLMDYQFIVGGQVCVDKDFRGRGLIASLYQHTKNLVGENYQLCVTEISTRNVKSLKAHEKIGFEVIGIYNDGTEDWNLVVWKY